MAMMHICTAVKLDQVTVSRRFTGRQLTWWPEYSDKNGVLIREVS